MSCPLREVALMAVREMLRQKRSLAATSSSSSSSFHQRHHPLDHRHLFLQCHHQCQQDCNSEECPEWNPWSKWTQCRFYLNFWSDVDLIQTQSNITSPSESCDDDTYLQQDLWWWREVKRSRLCVAFLSERQQRSRMLGRC